MTTLAIAALTVATLVYVLWPLRRRREGTGATADLPLDQLEAPPGEGER